MCVCGRTIHLNISKQDPSVPSSLDPHDKSLQNSYESHVDGRQSDATVASDSNGACLYETDGGSLRVERTLESNAVAEPPGEVGGRPFKDTRKRPKGNGFVGWGRIRKREAASGAISNKPTSPGKENKYDVDVADAGVTSEVEVGVDYNLGGSCRRS